MLNLMELNPQPETWTINVDKKVVHLDFRPFNLSDVSWLESNFTSIQIISVFQNIDIENLCRIAFHQLTVECKIDLFKIKFEEVDEETGAVTETQYTGPQRLMCLMSGDKISGLYDLILKLRGISLETIEKVESDPEVKKLLAQM